MLNFYPKINKIGSVVIGIVIAVILGVLALNMGGVFTRASDIEPRDVVISDIAQNNAKISWVTGIETQGVVEYGTTPTALNFFAPEATKTKNHLVELTLLSPQTTYYFQIRIGDKKYDNGGVPWTFTTRGAEVQPLSGQPTPTSTSQIQPTPTPIQSLEIKTNSTNTSTTLSCNETDCAKIKEKLGKGCTTQDYFRCLKKLTPAATLTSSPTPANSK
jgi:hypothetical protein